MAFNMIPMLHPKERRSTICVQVSRKWEYQGTDDTSPIQHVDMVLVDEKGNAIYAEIPAAQIETHSHLLHVEQVYVISQFKVCNAKTQYKPVDRQYMLEITCHTVVNIARNPPLTFPKFVYNLTSFSQIPTLLGDRRNLVDIIGIITQVAEPEWTHLPSQPNPTLTRNIFLKDLNELELRVTLWGQRAVQFNIDEVYKETEAKPIVILFLGGLIKNYQNDYYYSGNSATHWHFNPNIPEANILYNNLQNHRMEIKMKWSSSSEFSSTTDIAAAGSQIA